MYKNKNGAIAHATPQNQRLKSKMGNETPGQNLRNKIPGCGPW